MIEVAHYSGLVPLLGVIALHFGRGPVKPPYWMVAVGFSASWFADSFAALAGGSWAATHVYAPVQLGLFSWALGTAWFGGVLLMLAIGQAVYTDLASPDVFVTLCGSVGVLWLARSSDLWLTMLVYCGLASALYIVLVTEMWSEAFRPTWYAYQSSRLTAFALFGRAVWRTT